MSDVRTFTLDTNKMFSELETASEKKCQSLFIFRKLEKTEKVLLSKIKGALKLQHNDKVSQAELTDEAYRHVRYAEWLKEYSKAEQEFNRDRDRYNNLIALKDMRITEESSARYLINKK